MGPKRTGELWVYIGTPLPNPSGTTGVMVRMYVLILYNICVYFIEDFRLVLIINPGSHKMSPFTDINDVQDKLRKYINEIPRKNQTGTCPCLFANPSYMRGGCLNH